MDGTTSILAKSAVEFAINDLPEDVLIGIFSNLPLRDRKNARLVCKFWHNLSYASSLIQKDITVLHKNIELMRKPSPYSKHVNVRIKMNYVDKKTLSVIGNSVWFWSNHCLNLRTLELEIVGNDVSFLSKIFFFVPLLEHISVIARDFSHGHDLSFFDKVQFLNLRSLTLRGKNEILVLMLKVALIKAPKLVTVVVAFEEDVYASKKAQISWDLDFKPATNLKEIIFIGTRVNDCITGMVDIFGPKIEKLTVLIWDDNLSFNPMENILKRCVNLKHLVLDKTPGQKFSPLLPIFLLNSLTSISLGSSIELTDDMFASLALLNNIAYFDLNCSPELRSRGIIEVFGRRARPEMIELRLENVSYNYDFMVEIAPNLPNLKVLCLSLCKITKKSLESIITYNTSLQCLTLKGHYNEKPPHNLLSISRMSHLIHLDVLNVDIPQKIVKNLELPSLKFLFCKYKNFKPKGLHVLKKCQYVRCCINAVQSYRPKQCLTCCNSPFVNTVI